MGKRCSYRSNVDYFVGTNATPAAVAQKKVQNAMLQVQDPVLALTFMLYA
jgi:hypothetical protein